jgi:hypothetical protein
MDVRRFIGGSYRKPADLGDETVELTIVDVEEGSWNKLDLTFDDGSKLSVNSTNGQMLARHYGINSEQWIDKVVALKAGTVPFDGKDTPTILLKPVSPALPPEVLKARAAEIRAVEKLAREQTKKTPPDDPIGDDLPF